MKYEYEHADGNNSNLSLSLFINSLFSLLTTNTAQCLGRKGYLSK